MNTTINLLVREVETFLKPLADAADNEDQLRDLFNLLGFNHLSEDQVERISEQLDPFDHAYNEFNEEEYSTVITARNKAREVIKKVHDLQSLPDDEFDTIVEDLLEHLADLYLQTDHNIVDEVSEDLKITIGEWDVESSLIEKTNDVEFDVETTANKSEVKISPHEDADKFLQYILPKKGMRTEFDLGIGWSTERNIYFVGSSDLEADIPIHASLGETLSFDRLGLQVDPAQLQGGEAIPVSVVGTFGTKLGPISAVVEDVGLSANLSYQESDTGSPGSVDVSVQFKSPGGAGLSIDASAVVGGGYLEFDPVRKRYAGTLQLEVGSLALNAIGLLTTQLPNDNDGFSLLIIITGEFPPVQLGFGFTLNAVGGLLGINRSTQVDILRSGVRTGTVGSVLFPRDPVTNAPQIISDLRRIFPPTADRHVFGPMVRIGWGTPTLITAEVGVLLEFPLPIRLIILGRISALLPDEKAAIVALNMDALGVIDFGEGTASVDASLYDSRILAFTLTGDMAMRANWGNNPGFGLSVGGFNPRYNPPPEFPEMRRVAIDLSSGKYLRIRLEGYFAVTSNSAQFGSKLDLYAGVGKFSIQGYLGFDALFQFNPFRFAIDIYAGVALKVGKVTILSIDLSGTLAGPIPWHIRGKAKFKILFLSFSVGFDKKFGRKDSPAPLPPADVFGELMSALSETGNWAAQVPEGGHSFVTLREITPANDQVLVHPLGELRLRQRIVPLDVQIDKYGNATPAEYDQFWIEDITITGQSPQSTNEGTVGDVLREQFAPAQFFDISDADKLSKPGFEPYQAGYRIQNSKMLNFSWKSDDGTDPTVATTLDYETTYIDEHFGVDGDDIWKIVGLPADVANALADVGSVANSPLRTTGREKFGGRDQQIELGDTGFVVASTVNLAHTTDDGLPSTATTRMEAEQALEEYTASHPEEATDLQVVHAHHARTDGGDEQ